MTLFDCPPSQNAQPILKLIGKPVEHFVRWGRQLPVWDLASGAPNCFENARVPLLPDIRF